MAAPRQRSRGSPDYEAGRKAGIDAARVAQRSRRKHIGKESLGNERPLQSQQDVVSEMRTLYYAMRNGVIDSAECYRQTRTLLMLGAQLEVARLETARAAGELDSRPGGLESVPDWLAVIYQRGKNLLAAPTGEDQPVRFVDADSWEERPQTPVADSQVPGSGGGA